MKFINGYLAIPFFPEIKCNQFAEAKLSTSFLFKKMCNRFKDFGKKASTLTRFIDKLLFTLFYFSIYTRFTFHPFVFYATIFKHVLSIYFAREMMIIICWAESRYDIEGVWKLLKSGTIEKAWVIKETFIQPEKHFKPNQNVTKSFINSHKCSII